MTHSITLTLPDQLYGPLNRMAQANHQPLEEVLVVALQASLPSLDGLPPDLTQDLVALEELDDQALQSVLLETVPSIQQNILDDLLWRNQAGTITATEREQLSSTQHSADRLILRNARAAVLLRFRGQRLPTLTELRQLTTAHP